jgi:hypothetical protein
MSRRPGIGKRWFDEYKEDCFPSDEVPVPGTGVLQKVPRYYDESFRRDAPEEFERVKQARQEFRAKHADEYTSARLMAKYKVMKAKRDLLKRGLENET